MGLNHNKPKKTNLIPIIKNANKTNFLNKFWEIFFLKNSPIEKPANTKNKPNNDLIAVSIVKTPAIINPRARGKQPDNSKKPAVPINFSFEMPLAIKYIATGGDQIELNPPKTPAIDPNIICQIIFLSIFNFTPIKSFITNTIIAIPIDMVKKSVGYKFINIDTQKILKIKTKEKYLYSFITWILFSDLKNCATFVNIIGRVSKEIATFGSITNVNKAIAAEGNPIPRNPLIIPEIKNVKTRKNKRL